VAPTLLTLMHLDVPAEMTGRSLVRLQERRTA
jgi:bisphosphoglycerate-independent phosphoglycerate mutase (AlkP superfamily)